MDIFKIIIVVIVLFIIASFWPKKGQTNPPLPENVDWQEVEGHYGESVGTKKGELIPVSKQVQSGEESNNASDDLAQSEKAANLELDQKRDQLRNEEQVILSQLVETYSENGTKKLALVLDQMEKKPKVSNVEVEKGTEAEKGRDPGGPS